MPGGEVTKFYFSNIRCIDINYCSFPITGPHFYWKQIKIVQVTGKWAQASKGYLQVYLRGFIV